MAAEPGGGFARLLSLMRLPAVPVLLLTLLSVGPGFCYVNATAVPISDDSYRVCVSQFAPYIFCDSTRTTSNITGYEWDLWLAVAQQLNITRFSSESVSSYDLMMKRLTLPRSDPQSCDIALSSNPVTMEVGGYFSPPLPGMEGGWENKGYGHALPGRQVCQIWIHR